MEKVWGDDLRIEGVVVEMLDGVDDLAGAIRDFKPGPSRRMGVLVDHLVPGTKESRLVDEARSVGRYAPFVKILGHPYVDVWQSVRPERLGFRTWPVIPRGTSWKHGIVRRAGVAAPDADRHRPRVEADPRHGAHLCRPRAVAAGQRRGAHRLRHHCRGLRSPS